MKARKELINNINGCEATKGFLYLIRTPFRLPVIIIFPVPFGCKDGAS